MRKDKQHTRIFHFKNTPCSVFLRRWIYSNGIPLPGQKWKMLCKNYFIAFCHPYILHQVTEYMSRGSLQYILHKEHQTELPWPRRISFALGIWVEPRLCVWLSPRSHVLNTDTAQGVRFLHDSARVHRDLKVCKLKSLKHYAFRMLT